MECGCSNAASLQSVQQQRQNKKEDYSLYQDQTPALLGVSALQPEPQGWREVGVGRQ